MRILKTKIVFDIPKHGKIMFISQKKHLILKSVTNDHIFERCLSKKEGQRLILELKRLVYNVDGMA